MNPTLTPGTSLQYKLDFLVDGLTVKQLAYASEGLRYYAFLDLLQKTTQQSDGLERSYVFSTLNAEGQLLRGPCIAGFWTGDQQARSPLEASERYMQ